VQPSGQTIFAKNPLRNEVCFGNNDDKLAQDKMILCSTTITENKCPGTMNGKCGTQHLKT